MPVEPLPERPARPAAVVDAVIRQFTRGRLVWSPEALAELGRLRAEWLDAVRHEQQLAA